MTSISKTKMYRLKLRGDWLIYFLDIYLIYGPTLSLFVQFTNCGFTNKAASSINWNPNLVERGSWM
jgi:hypothetical protein